MPTPIASSPAPRPPVAFDVLAACASLPGWLAREVSGLVLDLTLGREDPYVYVSVTARH
jgi:hypothetical protein